MRPQVAILEDVFAYVKDWSVAIDGGANVGDWTAKLRERFDTVIAVDAAEECANLLLDRFGEDRGVRVWHCALMSSPGWVSVKSPNKKPASQKRYVVSDPKGETRALTIDDMALKSCGLIKLDLEGAEGEALLGAVGTIARCKPVLIVEFYKDQSLRFGHPEPFILGLINDMGYRQVLASYPDRVFVHAD